MYTGVVQFCIGCSPLSEPALQPEAHRDRPAGVSEYAHANATQRGHCAFPATGGRVEFDVVIFAGDMNVEAGERDILTQSDGTV
jgi:hypothetical protein